VLFQPYMSGTSFLCGLRPSVRSFPVLVPLILDTRVWLAFPTAEYYA
jgi:hypothetical protein